MATVTGLILVKEMPYRDVPAEEWSSRYWLTAPPPTLDADWKTLADALIAEEKKLYLPTCKVIRAYGYNDNTDAAFTVWVHDYKAAGASVPGTLVPSANGRNMAGDQASMIEWRTSRRNLRGKWIYLRKYMHDGSVTGTAADTIDTNALTANLAFGTKLSDGTFAGARKIRSALQDEVIQLVIASQYVTTRTLKRRGKRPPATPTRSLPPA